MKFRFLIPLLFAAPLVAQTPSCTGATCNALSVSQTDFINAWPTSGNTNPTVTITIPTSTAHWTSQVTLTVPAAVTHLIIQGNSGVNCTGTAGTATYACTPTDNTTIIDDIAGNFGVLQINGSSGTNPLIEVTGLTIQNGSGGNKFQGLLLFYSNNSGSQLRIDHNHFNLTTGTSGTGWDGRLNGCFTGVGDHNVFDSSSPTSTSGVNQAFMNSNTCGSDGNGDAAWTTATGYGSANFFFWENNVYNGGLFGDCIQGGKFVSRFNTFNSNTQSSSWIHNHGTAENGGRARGCRAFEANNNYLNPIAHGSVMIGDAGGSGLIWGNTISTTSAFLLAVGDERNDGQHFQTAPPNGWGFCGPGTINPNTGLANGVGSPWDEGVDSTGRACLDGIGRGRGAQAITGAQGSCSPPSPCPTGPNVKNSTTGTVAWTQEFLEPVYTWMNTVASTPLLSIASAATVQNRDIYVDSASFTGASGTGFGIASARPATCTAGPGGAYGASPTGSYGVAYFETDTGLLDICTATNTWGVQFNPQYTYPHPLVSGLPATNAPTFTPSTGAPPQTVTMACSTSGSIGCYTTNGSTPTATVAGTCDGLPTNTYSSPISITINPTTLNGICTKAAFTNSTQASSTYSGSSPVCGNPTELSPNFGGSYAIPPPTLPMAIGFVSPTSGCNMFYTATTNGSTPATPTCSSTAYPGANFSLSLAGTYKYRVIACQSGFTSSGVVGDAWTVSTPPGLWNSFAGWDTCVKPGCNPGGTGTPVSTSQIIGNQSPTLSGSTMSMSLVANTNSTNALWSWFGADCDLCSNFSANFEGYAPPSSNLGAWELDTAFLFSVGLNREFMWGMQYCLLGAGCVGGHSSWDIWDQGSGTWIDTGITPAPNFNAWNHIQTTNHRVGNSQVYDTFTLNGTLHTLNTTETSSGLPGGFGSGTGFQFQLDASTPSGTQTYTMYLDQATFTDALDTPTFSPTAGTYSSTQNVTISSQTAGATICYTTNGSTPTSSPAGSCAAGSFQYVSPVSVASSLTLKAITTLSGSPDSAVGSAAYTILTTLVTPTLTPGLGAPPQTVSISSSDVGATYCFTSTGATPTATVAGTCDSAPTQTYSTPISVTIDPTTIKAIATEAGHTNSAVITGIYQSIPTFTWTVTATNGTVTGTNCATGSGIAFGTNIGPCTATPNAGYTFTSWSGVSGSAGCSGATNPCPMFSITANSGATALFNFTGPTINVQIAGLTKFSGKAAIR